MKLEKSDSARYYTRPQKLRSIKAFANDDTFDLLTDEEISRVFNLLSRASIRQESGLIEEPEEKKVQKTLVRRNKKNV